MKDSNGIELIHIICGKHCHNLMKKDVEITKVKERIGPTHQPKGKSGRKPIDKINWSSDGTEQFLV